MCETIAARVQPAPPQRADNQLLGPILWGCPLLCMAVLGVLGFSWVQLRCSHACCLGVFSWLWPLHSFAKHESSLAEFGAQQGPKFAIHGGYLGLLKSVFGQGWYRADSQFEEFVGHAPIVRQQLDTFRLPPRAVHTDKASTHAQLLYFSCMHDCCRSRELSCLPASRDKLSNVASPRPTLFLKLRFCTSSE